LKSDCFKAWKTLGKLDANVSYKYEKDVGRVDGLSY
jgi:hypothetical protein